MCALSQRGLIALFMLLFGVMISAGPAAAQYGTYRAPENAYRVVATNDLLTDTRWYRFVYADDGSVPMASIIETRRYRLFYPRTYQHQVSTEAIQKILDQGFDRAERLMGRMVRQTDIYIAKQILPKSSPCEEGVITNGLAFAHNGRQVVVLRLEAASVSLVAHEALHIRVDERGAAPPSWFEEGMAEFAESEDGFSDAHFAQLEKLGPLTIDEMGNLKPCSKKGLQARSTAWAMVFYLVKIEGRTLAELQFLREFPDPQAAADEVKAWRQRAEAHVATAAPASR